LFGPFGALISPVILLALPACCLLTDSLSSVVPQW
jgi:hypothetical protein